MAFVEPSDGARIVKEVSLDRGVRVALSGTVQPGDPLAVDTRDDKWYRADASIEEQANVGLYAGQGGKSGDSIMAYPEASIDFGSGCTATIGAALYLSDTAGDFGTSAGTITRQIGRMVTAQVGHVWVPHS